MTHRRSKWPTRTIEIDPVEMQSVSFPSSETLPRDESLVSGLLWAGADLFYDRLDQRSGIAPCPRNFLALSDRIIVSTVAHHAAEY